MRWAAEALVNQTLGHPAVGTLQVPDDAGIDHLLEAVHDLGFVQFVVLVPGDESTRSGNPCSRANLPSRLPRSCSLSRKRESV